MTMLKNAAAQDRKKALLVMRLVFTAQIPLWYWLTIGIPQWRVEQMRLDERARHETPRRQLEEQLQAAHAVFERMEFVTGGMIALVVVQIVLARRRQRLDSAGASSVA